MSGDRREGDAVKTQQVRQSSRWLMAGILAALLPIFWAATATAADVQVNYLAETLVELKGGNGSLAWNLRYGTQPYFKLIVVPAGPDRAWFSHAGWLRLVDTKNGVVVGRWRFPWQIVRLVPSGSQVQVEIVESEFGRMFHRTLTFDPQAPEVPFWPTNLAHLHLVSLDEARTLLYPAVNEGLIRTRSTLSLGTISSERARQLVPDAEESVRRDPLSPWLRFALAKVLRDGRDPRAREAFAEIARVPAADFAELFIIAANLQMLGQFDVAREVFERGYADFLRHDNDPRLFFSLRLRELFAVFPRMLPTKERPDVIEHLYWLSPGVEGMEQAWLLYGDFLDKQGDTVAARKWRARAEELRTSPPVPLLFETTRVVDRAMAILFASMFAAVLFVVVLYLRYRPQRRLDLAARDRPRSFSFLHTQYWSRRERIAFLLIILVGWYAAGLVGGFFADVRIFERRPMGVLAGSFAGPVATSYFEDQFPASPQRDLCLAFAYQQSGENEKAEHLYRQLPDFAESWNNLGVLLKNSGHAAEARQAFQRALQLEPGMQEATWNLGKQANGFWAELHQRFVPDRPMLAPPHRSRIAELLYGPSPREIYWRALRGVYGASSLSLILNPVLPRAAGEVLLATLLFCSLVILFLLPQWDVTQRPGKLQTVWEALLPGTAPGWGFLGGVVLLLWAYIPLLLLTGNPILNAHYFYFDASYMASNLVLSHGVPFPEEMFARPSTMWLVAAAGLFAANLILIWRSHKH